MTAHPVALAPVHRLLLRRELDSQDFDAVVRALDRRRGAAPVRLADVAAALSAQGLHARVHAARPEDLAGFPLPTLVATRSGGFALVTSVRPRALAVEDARGRATWLSFAAAAEQLDGDALDLSTPIDGTSGFVGALFAHVRDAPQLRAVLAKLGALFALRTAVFAGSPLLVRAVMDAALPSGGTSLLAALAIAMAVLAMQDAWIVWLTDQSTRFFDARVRFAAVQGAFAHALRLPFAVARERGYGVLAQDLASTEEVPNRLLANVVTPLFDGLLGFVYVVLLAITSPAVAAFATAAGLAIVGLGIVAGHRFASRTIAAVERGAAQRTELDQLLSGVATLKQCGAERERGARWYDAFLREQTAAFDAGRIDLANKRAAVLVRQVTTAAVLLWCASRAVAGAMTVGDLVVCGQLAAGLLGAAERFTVLPLQLRIGRYHLQRGVALFAEPREVRGDDDGAGASASPLRRADDEAIAIDGLWFRHDPASPWLFRDLSLTVRYGETTSIAWPSGAGKTTLLRLIAGLLEPERGAIRVDGLDPRRARSRVTYLPQTTVLFEGSIRDNLRLLSRGASVERIAIAAEVTGLADLLRTLPMGLETLLSRRGTNLSGGQRQLVLLTAALASDRPIVLLDEAMAHVDGLARARLRASALFAGRAVVVVAHEAT